MKLKTLTTATPHTIDAENVKSFMLAGDAIMTFHSSKSGRHLTYRVTKHETEQLWYVKVLTNPDNRNGYSYLGTLIINREGVVTYRHGTRSSIGINAESVNVFNWVILRLDKPELLKALTIRHEGYCAKCGKMLTTPESVVKGLGPICAKRKVLR